MGKFRTIVAAVAGFCLCCCVWGDVRATCGCVGKFRTIVAAVAGFCLCCVCGGGAAATCGCVGKFCTIVAAVAGFCLCCVVFGAMVQRDLRLGAWVNSAQSLRPLPAFICVVFTAICGCRG